MSFDALSWAAKQNTGSSGSKLVLLGLAECANRKDGRAFPSIAELVEFSSLDRKSVIRNLDKLEAAGFITDTGQKVGRTMQIKVYILNLESIPKTEQSQKRNSPENDANGPKNGTRNLSEPVPSEAKASSGKARKRASEFEIPDWVPGEPWAAYDEMRIGMKHKWPWTDYARKCTISDLEKLVAEGHDPVRVLNLAVARGYRGVFGNDNTRGASVGTAAKRPMNAEELRNAIRYAEDHDNPERAAECKRMLEALQSKAGSSSPQVRDLISRTAGAMRQ